MPPLVSIIIPCLNAAPWLLDSLGSCFGQTYPSIEVILVDNGSTDDSLAVAKRFEDPRLLTTRCERRGASAARNEGLSIAQGEFIQYLDADDLISPDKIESQVRLLCECPADRVALSAMGKFYDGQNWLNGLFHDGPPLVSSENPAGWLIDLLNAKKHGLVPVGSWLTPRHLIDKAGPWNEELSFNDDGEYFARVVLASKGILKAGSGVYYYRQFSKSSSLSGQQGEPHLRSALKAWDLIFGYLSARVEADVVNQTMARHYLEVAYRAYPAMPAISKAAMQRVSDLGGTSFVPPVGSWRVELLRKLAGWKVARTVVHYANNLKR